MVPSAEYREKEFNWFVDELKIVIHTDSGDVTRDLRDTPFTDGWRYYGKMAAAWWSASIRCSDYKDIAYLGAKHEIDFAFYYDPTNEDTASNIFPKGDEVMAVEFGFQGAYEKDLVYKGKILFSYVGHGQQKVAGAFWVDITIGKVFGLP